MNNLIKELLEKSAVYDDASGYFIKTDQEKFAKLIVEECASQLCCEKFVNSTDKNKVMVGQAVILNYFGL